MYDLSTDRFPEDDCLWVYGVDEDGVPAFTKDGGFDLRRCAAGGSLVSDDRSRPRPP